jgi:diketogulonate reductase-like aldo/keto reductase
VDETFPWADFENGLDAVEEIRPLVLEGMTMAQFTLRWLLMFEAVTCAILGAKDACQSTWNAQAAETPRLSSETMHAVRAIYDVRIPPRVLSRWQSWLVVLWPQAPIPEASCSGSLKLGVAVRLRFPV